MSAEGSFSFCDGCPAHSNCCTGKTVDLPILTPADTQRISEETGIPRPDFCSETEGRLLTMRARPGGGCYFYRDGKCSVYDVRPIDCRMFPFDVERTESGQLAAIVYSTACPKPTDALKHAGRVGELLREIEPYLDEYASSEAPKLAGHQRQAVAQIKARPALSLVQIEAASEPSTHRDR